MAIWASSLSKDHDMKNDSDGIGSAVNVLVSVASASSLSKHERCPVVRT